jgi:hypothetical protein
VQFTTKDFWSTQSFEIHDLEMNYSWEVVLAMMWKLSAPNLQTVHSLLHHLSCTPMELSCPSHSSRVLVLLVVGLLKSTLFCTWLCAPVECWMFWLTYLPNTSIKLCKVMELQRYLPNTSIRNMLLQSVVTSVFLFSYVWR